jgi:hypothetical protein
MINESEQRKKQNGYNFLIWRTFSHKAEKDSENHPNRVNGRTDGRRSELLKTELGQSTIRADSPVHNQKPMTSQSIVRNILAFLDRIVIISALSANFVEIIRIWFGRSKNDMMTVTHERWA